MWRIPLDTTKKLKGNEKPSLEYKLIIYKHCLACILLIKTLPSMYFRVNLKMKKSTLCCCFTWIVFIELNFTVAFLLIKKTWNDRFAGEMGGGGILRNGGGILVMGGWFWNGGWYPFTDYEAILDNCFSLNPVYLLKKRRFCAAGKPSVFTKLEIFQ